jgi:hypothetical protein
MSKNLNNSDLISAYFDGSMSNAEKLEFENLLNQDPILRGEFEFQEDIVNGLKEFRKGELKARLGAIDVTPGLFSQLMNVKVAASIITASILTITTFYFLNSSDQSDGELQYVVHLEDGITLPSLEIPRKPNATTAIVETNQIIPEEKVSTSIKVRNVKETGKPINNLPESSQKTIAEAKSPELKKPVVYSEFDDTDIVGPSDKSPVFSKAENNLAKSKSTIEIETKTETKYALHYKYFSNKLFLYGDFKNAPYEILELNTDNDKKLYLFHNDTYFYIRKNEKITPLEAITTPKLIKELNIIKENKN